MLYSKEELGLLVGKKINKENLKKLFKRYFIDWIADGYIGKNLNIFEISTITGETDKDLKIISNLMVEALENQENLKIIYQNFSIEVKEIFETVALGEKFIIKEEDIEKYWLKSLDKEEKENFDLISTMKIRNFIFILMMNLFQFLEILLKLKEKIII